MEKDILTRLLLMEKRYRKLRFFLILIVLLNGVGILLMGLNHTGEFNIIRAKGIVIEDANGRDRILIGSPIPYSKNRVRTDTLAVRKFWAKNFGDQENQYMEWYKNYRHDAEGIVIMNEDGFDRVLVGDKLADPNSGQRMFEPAGILWNDKQGWELGGAGVNTTEDGKSRSVIGVDSKEGEAVHLVALEDGTKGLVIGGDNGRLLIGMSKKNGLWFKNENEFTGVKYFDATGNLVWEQKMDK